MIDTWATIGSCANRTQRPYQWRCGYWRGIGTGTSLPVIIEDNCFIGSRAIIVEGVRVQQGAVIAANVSLTQSTKIIDVTEKTPKEYKGVVPENSVVIPGSYSKQYPAGEYQIACALIIGKRKESTNKKTSLNEALRDFNIA